MGDLARVKKKEEILFLSKIKETIKKYSMSPVLIRINETAMRYHLSHLLAINKTKAKFK